MKRRFKYQLLRHVPTNTFSHCIVDTKLKQAAPFTNKETAKNALACDDEYILSLRLSFIPRKEYRVK